MTGCISVETGEQFHQQRNLRADQDAEQHREEDQRGGVDVEPGVGGVEREHRKPAEQRQRQFDRDESRRRVSAQWFRGERAQPHRENHDAQGDRGLRGGVAEQIAAEGDQRQLVHETAGRADERGGEQGDASSSDPLRQRAYDDGGHCAYFPL